MTSNKGYSVGNHDNSSQKIEGNPERPFLKHVMENPGIGTFWELKKHRR